MSFRDASGVSKLMLIIF